MENKDYIKALIQSLEKKVSILQEVRKLNEAQRELLEDSDPSLSEWEKLTEKKGELIDQINFLDDGFNEVYEHVREEILNNKDKYKSEILSMQELISRLTGLSVDIKAEELRNKEAAQYHFARLKKKGRTIARSGRAASVYKDVMQRVNKVDPQFLDKKK